MTGAVLGLLRVLIHGLRPVLIIIKPLIFFSAFIYQLLYQLRPRTPPTHSHAASSLPPFSMRFSPIFSLLFFMHVPCATFNNLFPPIHKLKIISVNAPTQFASRLRRAAMLAGQSAVGFAGRSGGAMMRFGGGCWGRLWAGGEAGEVFIFNFGILL